MFEVEAACGFFWSALSAAVLAKRPYPDKAGASGRMLAFARCKCDADIFP
jgi:hypothetical protein